MATANNLLGFFDQRYYESACAGKQPYPTLVAAETVSQMYHSNRIKHHRTRQDTWAELVAYSCPHCGQFHLGH